jgi:thiosulfate reductase cytochrome b subunit
VRPPPRDKIIHPLFVRITHWINAIAVMVMLMSGWRIYNASPMFDGVRFPPEMTLGGWLAGALAWHFAVMWLLVLNGLASMIYGVFSGHFWRDLIRFSPMPAYRDLRLEFRTLLLHGTGEYNIVQRVLYICAIWIVIALVVSGIAMWKPVQFQALTAFLGGYEQARRLHFFAMVGVVAFFVIHVGVAFAVKGTMQSMFTGRLAKHMPGAGQNK